MRPLAGLAIALIGLNTAGAACAQSARAPADTPADADRLMEAAFKPQAAREFDAPAAQADPISALLDRDAWRPDQGLTRWGVKEMVVGGAPDGSTVDSVRLRVGETLPQKTPTALDLARREAEAEAYDVTVTRNWPHMVAFESARYDIDLTPHAGFGVGSSGGSAEAGATLTLGAKSASQQVSQGLRRLGFHEGMKDGDSGRWYVFAAASGRAVGLSLARDPGASWNRTIDNSSALIGDAQVGVGWRKGAMQTSLGYIHRSVKGDHMIWGEGAQDDSMVAFSLSIKPKH